MKFAGKESIIISVFLTVALIFALAVLTASAEELSGNEILVKVDEKSEKVTQGDMLSVINFHNVNADGTELQVRGAGAEEEWRTKPDAYLLP